MGTRSAVEIDHWLTAGGLVLAASDRAARYLRADFHQRRRAAGLSAWPEPEIHSLSTFLHSAWLQRTRDDRLVLNPAQEQSLWAGIAAREHSLATALDRPLHHLASLASEAHNLLCAYAPRLLRDSARAGWSQDAAAFSAWLTVFDQSCHRDHLLSPSRLPLELTSLLQADASPRPPLLLAGFDRILTTQRDLFNAWGSWQPLSLPEPAPEIRYHAAPDSASELNACALWCMHRLVEHPNAQILVLTQEIATRRGQIERAFLRTTAPTALPPFEFSLGIPLANVPLPRAALLVLRWLTGPLAEQEIDWFFASGLAAALNDSSTLQARMRAIRHRHLESPQWSLADFLNLPNLSAPVPESWLKSITAAQQRLAATANRLQSSLDWAALVPQLLADLGLPDEHRLTSSEFQAYRRWQQALDTCASLGFDGQRLPWSGFLSALTRILDNTLFAPESANAPILIAGPAESAGLSADAIWFLSADEDSWPAHSSTHPLLPLAVQRDFSMPHATAQLDGQLAEAVTTRLLASAPVVHFSFARQHEDTDARPSRLVLRHAGTLQPLPPELLAPAHPTPLATVFLDDSRIPLSTDHAEVHGGAALLTAQSQCPFRAFATARLSAEDWEPAQPGLTARQRGLLLHAVLHAVWAGPPHGLRSSEDLLNLPDVSAFVAGHVRTALSSALPASVRARMPRPYLDLEAQRLTRLVSEWLQYEATRQPFAVLQTEAKANISLAQLSLALRLDRLDRLADNSLLVVDYKSGAHKPSEWDTARPEDVQLPLYATFALPQGESLGGLVFAQLRAGQPAFTGRLRNAKSTLDANLSAATSLVKAPLTDDQLTGWRNTIETLARDFLSGRADVDPLDPIATCERCSLHALCRIAEREDHLVADNDTEEVSDE